jgi:cold shock CspA family protein/ribosome-associated translation inhibitor RaiA
MPVPLELQFHNLDRSPTIEAEVQKHVAKLEKFASHLMSCRVTIEAPHKRHEQGNLFAVRVDLRYAGGEVVASRAPEQHHAHEDWRVALRDAFRAARRQLQDRTRLSRGQVKPHVAPPHGRIASLDAERDCGRITTSDGREIYFHRNSLVGTSFDQLTVGAEVRFEEELGEQGPQASSVHVLGRHHYAG